MSYHILNVICSTEGGFVNTTHDVVSFFITDFAADGASAYEIAVANGFVGTEAQWLLSLKGEPGTPGGGIKVTTTVVAISDGALTIPITNPIESPDVYINGLLQIDFTYTNTLVNLPASLNIKQDDIITIIYLSSSLV